MIVCANGFQDFDRFLSMLPAPFNQLRATATPDQLNFQFFTEYNFFESVFNIADRDRFAATLETFKTKETPDIVVYFSEPRPSLLAIEAKMFTPTPYAHFLTQMKVQKAALDAVAKSLSLAASDICHVARLPEKKLTSILRRFRLFLVTA